MAYAIRPWHGASRWRVSVIYRPAGRESVPEVGWRTVDPSTGEEPPRRSEPERAVVLVTGQVSCKPDTADMKGSRDPAERSVYAPAASST